VKNKFFSSLLILSLLAVASPAQERGRTATKPATSSAAATAAKPQTAYEIPFKVKTLANGMEVIVLPDSSVPVVTIEFAVRTGSITEPPELNGLSHLYEHMFFKPNSARLLVQCENAMKNGPLNPFGQQACASPLKLKSTIGDTSYLNEIDQIGIVNNAETHEEVVNYYLTVTTPHFLTALKFLKDSIRYPTFDDTDFAGEKQVVITELDRNMSQPFYFLDRALHDKLFYKYPTRKSPGGTRATVGAATTDQMRLIQSRYYMPNNSALIVTGDVNPDIVYGLAEQLFGDWPRGEDPFIKHPLVEHPPLTKSEGVIINQPVESVIIQTGWQGPSIGKDNAATYAADVFSYIVGQPDSKFQRAMIDSGLAVAADVHYYTQKNVGPIRMTIVTSPDKAKAAVKTLYSEIAQFANPTYFTDDELENAKTLLEAEDLYRREKLSDYTHSISFWWSTTGVDYYRGYHKNLRAVSRADIARYITNYIQNKPHIGMALISSEQQAVAKLTTDDLVGGKQ
jgi:zinc protease